MNDRGRITLVVALFLAGVGLFTGVMLLLGWWIQPPSTRQSGPISPLLESAPSASSSRKIGAPDTARRREVRIYFTPDGLKLQAQIIQLSQNLEPYKRLRFVLNELLHGPQGGLLQPPIPAQTRLRAAYLAQDTAVVDVSDDILSGRLGGPMAEWLCVSAIVNTVVDNVEGVRKVRLMVNGQTVTTLWGDVDLTTPLLPDSTLAVE